MPAVVDLACMRDAMNKLGSDSNKINPLVRLFPVLACKFPYLLDILGFSPMDEDFGFGGYIDNSFLWTYQKIFRDIFMQNCSGRKLIKTRGNTRKTLEHDEVNNYMDINRELRTQKYQGILTKNLKKKF